MLEKNKKLSFLVIGLAVAALAAITIWQPAQWSFRDPTDYNAAKRAADKELAQYKAFLEEAMPDQEASQQLLKKIATEEIVRKEVETALDVNQKIVIPKVADSEIRNNGRKDVGAVVNYLTDVTSMVANYRSTVGSGVTNLYSEYASVTDLERAKQETDKLVSNIRGMSVPAPAVELHKANLVSFMRYGELFDGARGYAVKEDLEPWDDVYQNYAIIDNRLAVVKAELTKLNGQYALEDALQNAGSGLLFKTAHAQLGGVTIVSADLERQVIEGIKEGLAKSFAQFAIKMLDKLVSHIEKNFAIASQLYYSNELGRFYSVEYMKKFVQDPFDQEIIKNFLPEYFCISPDKKKMREIFVAKARENMGNDLVISPSDPDFAEKLVRLGADEKNYPMWWEGYYEALAAKTRSEAESASTKEVTSPGFKTGRDIISNQVNKTVASIFNVQEAAISGAINLGTNNTSSPISRMVAGVVESMVNKFVFTPISGGSSKAGGIGVLQEKDVCLQVPKIKPIVPVASSEYPSGQGTIKAPVTTPPFSPRN